MEISLVLLPAGCVIARYAVVPGLGLGAISARGAWLAPSFFDLRASYSFVCALAGSGGWVVLAPVASQPALF